MYTEKYIAHQEKLAVAQLAFDKNPCRKTATVLSDLRETRVTMYTPEETAKRETLRQKEERIFWTEMWDLASNIKAGI